MLDSQSAKIARVLCDWRRSLSISQWNALTVDIGKALGYKDIGLAKWIKDCENAK